MSDHPFAVLLPDGRVCAFAASQHDALRLAYTRHSLKGEDLAVVWCRDGVAKVWLANISKGEIIKTRFWVDA